MVSHSVEASWRLYICIPANSSRDRREDSASDAPVPTAGGAATTRGAELSRARPPAAGTAASPTPHPAAAGARALPPPGAQDTSALRAEERPGRAAPAPPHSSVGGGDPAGAVTHHVPPSGPVGAKGRGESGAEPEWPAVRMRPPGSRARFPPRRPRAPSRRLATAPPAGREEVLRPAAAAATALVPGPSAHPERLRPLGASCRAGRRPVGSSPRLCSLPFMSSPLCVPHTSLPMLTGWTSPVDSSPNQNLVLPFWSPSFPETLPPALYK